MLFLLFEEYVTVLFQTATEFALTMNGLRSNLTFTSCHRYLGLELELSDLPTEVNWTREGYVTGIKDQVLNKKRNATLCLSSDSERTIEYIFTLFLSHRSLISQSVILT